jgi:hypothetical protein
MISIPVKGAAYAQSYVDELKQARLAIDTDFRWSYIPSKYDGWDDTTHTQPLLNVWFVNESLESFYRLKWGI